MNEEVHYTIHTNMVYLLIFTTLVLFIARSVLNFIDIPSFLYNSRDIDFRILLLGIDRPLLNFYDPVFVPEGVPDWPPYYLYFWYFIFYPMGLMPFDISVVIWDMLRLVISSYLVLKGFKIIKIRLNLLWFYLTIFIGFIIDGWYNNCNFLIMFFLLMSYTSLEKDKMWLSGIFFALSTIKINSVLFLPVLLITRKIKLKDSIYYIVPFTILCLPYVIFPDFLFFPMLANWGDSTPGVQGLTFLDPIIWKAIQPSHLMFLGFIFVIIFEFLEQYKRGHQIRTIIYLIFSFFYLYISITVWILPNIFNS